MNTDQIVNDWQKRRIHTPCTLVYLDLCNFSAFNQIFGHLATDKLLDYVESRLRLIVRSGDSVYRWGGDEFILFVPDTAASPIVERLRTALPVSFRWVYTCIRDDDDLLTKLHFVDLLLEHDKALEQAKWALELA